MRKYIALIILVLSMRSDAFAWTLTDDDSDILGKYIEYIEDVDKNYSLEQIQNGNLHWFKSGEDFFNKGFSGSVWWIKITIDNPMAVTKERLLEIGYPVLDHIQVFIVDADGRPVDQINLGDKLPYAQRPIDHHLFILPLRWTPRQTLHLYLRVKSDGVINVPLTLWKRSALIGFESKRIFWQSLFFGALGVFVFYNLLLFFWVHDRSCLYFVCSEGAALLFLGSLMGLTFRYLWPESTLWNDRAIPVFNFITILFGTLFLKRILRLDEISQAWSRLTLTGAGAGAFCIGMVFILPYHTSLRLAVSYSMIMMCTSFVAGLVFWRRGVGAARYCTGAFTAILMGYVPMTLSAIDWLPALKGIGVYTPYLGAMVGALLFSFALTEQINDDRRLRQEAQAQTLAATVHANTELERIIDERTRSKQELNRRLWELSNTDQLTGIKNRRYLTQSLDQECLRCRQKQRILAVVLADIDFFKRINDTYGHAAGDVCLCEVARRLSACLMRPGDELARYGGEEFCIILPETDIKGALEVAERMREAVACLPVRYEEQDIKVTISLGLTAMIPHADAGPDHLLQQADRALYDAKEKGRNRVGIKASPKKNIILPSKDNAHREKPDDSGANKC